MAVASPEASRFSSAAREMERAGARLTAYFRQQLPGRREDAEDLSQETMLAAWRLLSDPASAPPVADLPAYLLGIARHKMRDALRARIRERRFALAVRAGAAEPAASPLGPRLVERREGARRLHRLLRGCSPLERRLLLLRFLAELPHRDACFLAGIDPVQGSRVVYKALRRLRARWSRRENAAGEAAPGPIGCPSVPMDRPPPPAR